MPSPKKEKGNRNGTTTEDIETILDRWEDVESVGALAEELGWAHSHLNGVVKRIRKAGYKLPKKVRLSRVGIMVEEVLKDRKLI